LELISN